jgi:hypothetical protein
MYVDFVVNVDRTDRKAYDKTYPVQAVQANPSPPPPFVINQAFRAGFKKAVKAYGIEHVKMIDSLRPPQRLLDLIARAMPA